MGTDDNKAILRRFIEEAFNQGNLAVVDELVASDYINHVAGTDVSGREGTRQFIYQLSRSAARLPLHDCGSGCGRGQGRDPLDSQRHTGGGVHGDSAHRPACLDIRHRGRSGRRRKTGRNVAILAHISVVQAKSG